MGGLKTGWSDAPAAVYLYSFLVFSSDAPALALLRIT
jgi:hypothetical protein